MVLNSNALVYMDFLFRESVSLFILMEAFINWVSVSLFFNDIRVEVYISNVSFRMSSLFSKAASLFLLIKANVT